MAVGDGTSTFRYKAAMKRAELEFTEKDQPLRDDVSMLGTIVGEMLREQGGEELFARVEASRKAAILVRNGQSMGGEDLAWQIRNLSPAKAYDVIRAFSLYFQVVNLAEQIHRVRRRIDYLRNSEHPQPGGFRQLIRDLHANGVRKSDLQRLLGELQLEPVFTAHPTEAIRQTILRKHQRIAYDLVERFNPMLPPDEYETIRKRLQNEITLIWQTLEHPNERMTVADEREHALFYLTNVIYRIIPPLYETLETAIQEEFGEAAEDLQIPSLLHFCSWIGGDMDGNPNVGPETLRDSLGRQRALIVDAYFRETGSLSQLLSQSLKLVNVSRELDDRIREYGRLFPGVRQGVHPRHRDMPYRVYLKLVQARLRATFEDRKNAYGGPGDFLNDLRLLADSLRENKGTHAGLFKVRRLIRRVETFGFHIATLDVRQDSLVHRQVISELLGEPGWLSLEREQRTERLLKALQEPAPASLQSPSVEAEKLLEVFKTIGRCKKYFGAGAVGPYIISMSQGADDVLSVLLLARWAGIAEAGEPLPLDVAPLFETVADLEAGPDVMRELLALDPYRAHLAGRSHRQIVMVGYSDSNKDGGIAASRWGLYKAQAALAAVFEDADIELTIFHGRGGSISRGGGKTHRAVMAAPKGAVNGRLRTTEQGEIIDAKYGIRGIAVRNLERAISSLTRATLRERSIGNETYPNIRHNWLVIMDTIAEASRNEFRQLVYESPGFFDYFRQVTPIDVIERMQIGSRPASRRSGKGFENLRAIPWVFAWTQNRQMIPGWFGFGSGLRAAVDQHGIEAVKAMAGDWLYVASLLDDIEMVLAKTDLATSRHYLSLVDDEHRHFFKLIGNEFRRTAEAVLEIRDSERLLDHDKVLRRAIRLRNPYVDPMSILQVDLLKRWRAGDREDDELLRALYASVNGISQGLQNTG